MHISQHPYVNDSDVVVFAHQGDSAHAPTNTLPAFQRAVDAGADIFETDVHWTKDGVVVVSHDDTVDRMTDGTGFIKDKTYDELRKLDFGFRFSPDGGKTFPYRGQGITIPTLKELLLTFPNTRVNIDIKPKAPQSLARFIQDIYECKAEYRVLVASFHHKTLKQVRSMDRNLATSASPTEIANFCLRSWTHLPNVQRVPYLALQVPVKALGLNVVTKEFILRAHALGVKVHVWTIDDPKEMDQLLQMGVDGIMTNDPAMAVEQRRNFTQEQTA